MIADWDGNVGLSHDVSAKVIDLDYDGDLDIVIGSMIWSDEYPYGVIQLLMNNEGFSPTKPMKDCLTGYWPEIPPISWIL